MINLKTVVLVLCLLPTLGMATPQRIEMIFLSPLKISQLIRQIDQNEQFHFTKKIAQNEMSNCVPMGDGCFHPQLGFIEKSEFERSKPQLIEQNKLELKTFNATETSLVSCDKNNYFDIFCGAEKLNGVNSEIEIWFDISSSLKNVDYNRNPELCARRTFMEKVALGCKAKVSVSVYNTAIKQVGDHSGVCMAYGTNDQSRLLRWMKDSKAKHLLVVTDIDEMSIEMRKFLESNGAKMTGDGVKAFTSNDLIDYAKEFTKMCK